MNIIPRQVLDRYKNSLHFLTSVKETIKNGYPARKLKVIGVTGTDGKTTTAHLIYEILRKAGKRVALISTVAAYLDTGVIDTGHHVTTPDATFLQPLLRDMVKKGIEHVVLEASSHGLDQHRVLGCNFLVGVLTNVTREHLDYHKTFEAYRRSKRKLFRGVKYAVLNEDDGSFDYFLQSIKKGAQVISYGLAGSPILLAANIKENKTGSTFNIKSAGRVYSIKTALFGKYNVSNILASAGAAQALGIDWSLIKKGVADFRGVEGRMQEVNLGQPFRVIVDFAHTPNGLENLLATLTNQKEKNSRLIVVFGCAGERDREKRQAMGGISAKLADVSILTAEDPRREDVNSIIDRIMEGAKNAGATEVIKTELTNPRAPKKNRYVVEPDRKKAIELAISIARKGDIVAICGKGHERSINIGGVEIPWSDQEVVRQVLSIKY